MILQGSTLPALARALRLRDAVPPRQQEMQVRLELTRAALDKLAQLAQDIEVPADVLDDMRVQLEQQFRRYTISTNSKGLQAKKALIKNKKQLLRDLLTEQRDKLQAMWAEGTISDDLSRRIQRDLDLQELRL